VAQNSVAGQTILAIFPAGEDRTALVRIFGQADWRVEFAGGLEEAQAARHECAVAVVISETRLPDGHTWKDLLHDLQNVPDPPPLVVADRLADDRLWAEVLNLGAYDLLMTPFDAREVLRTVSLACGFRNDFPETAKARQDPLKSEAAGLS
jgi:DNA-binding NtrC family response regulator